MTNGKKKGFDWKGFFKYLVRGEAPTITKVTPNWYELDSWKRQDERDRIEKRAARREKEAEAEQKKAYTVSPEMQKMIDAGSDVEEISALKQQEKDLRRKRAARLVHIYNKVSWDVKDEKELKRAINGLTTHHNKPETRFRYQYNVDTFPVSVVYDFTEPNEKDRWKPEVRADYPESFVRAQLAKNAAASKAGAPPPPPTKEQAKEAEEEERMKLSFKEEDEDDDEFDDDEGEDWVDDPDADEDEDDEPPPPPPPPAPKPVKAPAVPAPKIPPKATPQDIAAAKKKQEADALAAHAAKNPQQFAASQKRGVPLPGQKPRENAPTPVAQKPEIVPYPHPGWEDDENELKGDEEVEQKKRAALAKIGSHRAGDKGDRIKDTGEEE